MFDPYEIRMRKNQSYIRTYFVGRMFRVGKRTKKQSFIPVGVRNDK